jgi:hypothetical protein
MVKPVYIIGHFYYNARSCLNATAPSSWCSCPVPAKSHKNVNAVLVILLNLYVLFVITMLKRFIYNKIILSWKYIYLYLLFLIIQSFDWLAAFHLGSLQAILLIAVQLSAPVFLATCFKDFSRGLPTAFFFRILLLEGCLLQTRYT